MGVIRDNPGIGETTIWIAKSYQKDKFQKLQCWGLQPNITHSRLNTVALHHRRVLALLQGGKDKGPPESLLKAGEAVTPLGACGHSGQDPPQENRPARTTAHFP